MSFYRDLEDVVDTLVKAKKEGTKVNLLIGAGCSISAGIPSASGIVEQIKKDYPREFARAETKDYSTCMSKLTTRERKALISDYVKNATTNWAHITIAHLMRLGYINRVLTTNFDNLILRACALLDEYPAVYDLASSKTFRSELLIEDKSVFHLHGQHTGFLLCNTDRELQEQFESLKPIYSHLKQNSVWIIVGYSGLNDSIFKLLEIETSFEHRLFWVGYQDHEPQEHLTNQLLSEEKYSFYVNGYDADTFFVTLARRLGDFPPEFIKKPFTHLSNLLDNVQKFRLPFNETQYVLDDLNSSTRSIVKEAVRRIESDNVLMATHFLNVGLEDEFDELLHKCTASERRVILDKYQEVVGETIKIITKLCEKIEDRLSQNPNDQEEYITLSLYLCKIGLLKFDLEGAEYYRRAEECFRKAAAIKDLSVNPLRLWAQCLLELSRIYQIDEEDMELAYDYAQQAVEKLEIVLSKDKEFPNIHRDLIIGYSNVLFVSDEIEENTKLIEYNQRIIEHCTDVPESDVDPEILRFWGVALLNRGGLVHLKQHPNKFAAFNDFFTAFEKLSEARLERSVPADIEFLGRLLENMYATHEDVENGVEKLSFIYQALLESVKTELAVVNGYEEDSLAYQAVKPGIEMLNSLSYNLINAGEYEMSMGLLTAYLQARQNDSFPHATLGLWYFMNLTIDEEIAWETGYKNYEKAIEIGKRNSDPAIDALIQKSRLEFAKFQFHRTRNLDQAVFYCSEVLEKGKIKYYESFFDEAKVLLSAISEYRSTNTTLDEVAAEKEC